MQRIKNIIKVLSTDNKSIKGLSTEDKVKISTKDKSSSKVLPDQYC